MTRIAIAIALAAAACAAPKPSCPPPGSRQVPLVGAVFGHDDNGYMPLGHDPVSEWLAQCRARANATGGNLESLAGIRGVWDCPPATPPIDFTRSRIEVLQFRMGDGIDFI